MRGSWLAIGLCAAAAAQPVPDRELAEAIARIPAIDSHAHPLRSVAAGEKPDDEFDALPCDALESAAPNPVRLRPDNPELIAAWRTLYGYPHDDAGAAHIQELLEAKRRVMAQRGAAYPAWILDQSGEETMLANRVAPGPGIAPPRFRWVSFVDALMLPFPGAPPAAANPDSRAFYAAEEKLLRRYLREAGVSALPAALEEYRRRVVTATLERHKRSGAIAIKFEAAYLRSLDFPAVPEAEAQRIYARQAAARDGSLDGYPRLQNYLLHFIAREAGRLGLPVQIHAALGCGDYFQLRNARPVLLESVVNHPALRQTRFVLIHGGWPATADMTALLSKPNVWTDTSFLALTLYPHALAGILRGWLEMYPEKVLFGTDAFAASPEVGWEETVWTGAATVRRALAIALTGMMQDGEISRPRALELARMVLRQNASHLYGIK